MSGSVYKCTLKTHQRAVSLLPISVIENVKSLQI